MSSSTFNAGSKRRKSWDRNERQFYLPHNFDTRGRVYHVTEFGHHNVDCLRTFKFARRKPLGEHGALFIALQLANTHGVDKRSIDDRIEWSGANEHAIIKAGEDFKSLEAVTVKVFKDDKLVDVETTVFDFWRQLMTRVNLSLPLVMNGQSKGVRAAQPGYGQDFMDYQSHWMPVNLAYSITPVRRLTREDGRLPICVHRPQLTSRVTSTLRCWLKPSD